ncbi:MAG TPA: multiheme c-type cytochrome [Candidatus Polarisedimenticolaceae bacterium]|nr:multiheme c-type cytochrome [Candidatus Polarisedimenticolaceae bacterium]
MAGTVEGKQRYVPAVGPGLKKLLAVVFALFALLVVNSVYLVSITIAGTHYQGWFYLMMFALHLLLGLALVLPVVVFGAQHIRNARNRRNKRAIRVGYALFSVAISVLVTGIVLMRVDLFGARLEINDPLARSAAYWLHVVLPLAAIWLFVLHRLAGRRIRWKVGLAWASVAALFALGMLALHSQDPRAWNVVGPKSGEQYFFPSLSRTSDGNFIPAEVLDNDHYCQECHADIHDQWSHSVHRFSSFNNPPYLFSVKNTRRAMMARDGTVQGSRFCAGCHDPVPFFSGQFDDPKFDDPEFDLASDETAQAGITCTVCHSISHVNSVRGNADFTIDEPVHYPFAFSENPTLRWVNRQLVKAKPEFHKATFLKPLHRTTEFCGTCHKVHLPPELNAYKWLRGQNHYDAFWLSGVSGHGIASFYYPPKAEPNCNNCHMPLAEVSERPNFAAKVRDESGALKTFGHQFPSANTAIPHLVRDQIADADRAIDEHRRFNEGVMRVDIFGVKSDGAIDGELTAPLRPELPALAPGETYLIEIVIRTVKIGHLFTQGTVDSNEVWMDVRASNAERVIGHSGWRDARDNSVDPESHFVNAFVIDRQGDRINRRNAEDIFIALYNNQIPPGAADVVHYRLRVPRDARGSIAIEAKLLYRKFDTEYMRLVTEDASYYNDLPIMTLAEDRVVFPVGGSRPIEQTEPAIERWQRWNDYGIALLDKGQLGELRQAAQAFAEVEKLGRADGPLNLARVYIKEGLVQQQAPAALARAAANDPPANEWSLLWFGAVIAEANGDYDLAIANLERIVRGGFEQAQGRDFEFHKDYRVQNQLGNALYQRGLLEQGETRKSYLERARDRFLEALSYDPENLTAHWGLQRVYGDLGTADKAREHAELHAKYKPDDNARDYAAAQARLKYPAANRAAEAVVIYDLDAPVEVDDALEVAKVEN